MSSFTDVYDITSTIGAASGFTPQLQPGGMWVISGHGNVLSADVVDTHELLRIYGLARYELQQRILRRCVEKPLLPDEACPELMPARLDPLPLIMDLVKLGLMRASPNGFSTTRAGEHCVDRIVGPG